MLKSYLLDVNTIVETKNAKFYEDVFPLKSRQPTGTNSDSFRIKPEQSLENHNEFMAEDLRRSKRQRKETSFGDDFYIYHVEDDPLSFTKAISSSGALSWEQAIKIEIDFTKKNNTWTLVDLPQGVKLVTPRFS